MTRTSSFCALLIVACAVSFQAIAQDDLRSRYGHATMPTSCAPQANSLVTRGLLQLHSFAWSQARDSFGEAAAADPACAMAYWGIAMSWYDDLHEPPEPDAVAAATSALATAQAIETKTPREIAWLDAARELFRGYPDTSRIERDRAYSEAMANIAATWPDDEEAKIFHALSLLALARRGDDPALIRQAAGILEPLFDMLPDHPGIAHYLIHAYDDLGDREPGLEAARRYAGIAPLMTHAQHMPSHIFAGLGMWPESNASNEMALEANPRYYHALMYIVYGHLQLGQWDEAKRQIVALERFAASPRGGNGEKRGLHQVHTWLLLETRDWEAAANAPMHSDRPLDAAETLYVRGLGAAYTGDYKAAQEAYRSLESLLGQLDTVNDSGLASRALLIKIQALEIQGIMALRLGQHDEAIHILRGAAELERMPELNRAPPDSGTGLPAHELLGEALLELQRYDDAVAAFEAALERTPRRLHSMLGLARAAAAAGDRIAARAHYTALLEMLDGADSGHAAVAEARTRIEDFDT